MEVLVGKHKVLFLKNSLEYGVIRALVAEKLGIQNKDFYLISNGKIINDETIAAHTIHVVLRTLGGKGGFGSMLRAIGAQIEKTTNREACRDLSGRRLRDINEEQRLKKWVAQQAEREKEAKEKKKKKLEKLCEKPKHEFNDKEYDKERSALPEMVEDAVLKGLEASCSGKRKSEQKPIILKKKLKLWLDNELNEDISSSENESDIEDNTPKTLENNVSGSEENSETNIPDKNQMLDGDSKEENPSSVHVLTDKTSKEEKSNDGFQNSTENLNEISDTTISKETKL